MRTSGWLATLMLVGCADGGVDVVDTRGLDAVATEVAESDGAESEAAESEAAESDGAESDGAESEAAESDGAESDGAESEAAESDGAESDGAESDPTGTDTDSDLRCDAGPKNACGLCNGPPVQGLGDRCENASGCDGFRVCNAEGTATICDAPADCGCPGASSASPARTNAHPVFTHDVTEVAKLSLIHPLGAAWGGEIRGHTYLQIDQTAGVQAVDVRAPVDAVLEAVIFYHYPDDPTRGDWGLRFRASCEVVFRLGHVTDPVATIRALWTGPPATDSRLWVELPTPIPFAAGDLIATTTGTREAHNFDFGVYNTTVVHQFANQARYLPPEPRPWDINYMVNSDCPYDYFADALRPAYMERLGGILAGGPVAGATCRSAMRDVVGTAAGAWWSDAPVDMPYRGRIGIVSEYTGFVVIGGLGPTGTLVFADAAPPESVTATHCYANDDAHVELSLVAADTLFVAYGDGGCPASPLSTPGGRTYVR